MTGAPIPSGADAVVMIEHSQSLGGAGLGRVRLTTAGTAPGNNIMRRAASMASGQTVLHAGTLVRAIEVGLLAEVGRTSASVVPRPSVAVLATGNELLPVQRKPGPGQIRNSNGPMLMAAAASAGASASDLGIGRDEPRTLRDLIARGLDHDVLVISGGVSAGVLDLVPGVLAELGVEQVFHKVNLKPGKPLWFGVAGKKCLVFGLPGNPVSSLVCFELFVRPAIGVLAGRGVTQPEAVSAALAQSFAHRSERPTYHPARLSSVEGSHAVEPLRWQGSGDLRTLVEANALALFEPGHREYAAGETIRVMKLR